ncbi:MAG TPA: M23 family metallopeptidase [bacterium]|nr:M23 family metallopeptidase [bacterium]
MPGLRLIAVVLLAIGTVVVPRFEREKGTAFAEYVQDARGGGDEVLCPVLKFGGDDLVCSPDQRSGFLAVASEAIWPLPGRVTSGFGNRRSPFYRATDFHEGIDIAARRGMPIRAVADGIVAFAGFERGYGRKIAIDHGFGASSVYGHASKLFVREGQWVQKGDVIGLVGSSGAATGPHLHYELRLARVPFDPRALYQGRFPL